MLYRSFVYSCHSNERLFLRDFVSCAGGTSGGRLARWLQPDSYVDVRACEVLYSRDDMRAGWPAIVTIITRDQYNEMVHVPSLKVSLWQSFRFSSNLQVNYSYTSIFYLLLVIFLAKYGTLIYFSKGQLINLRLKIKQVGGFLINTLYQPLAGGGCGCACDHRWGR